MTSASHLLTEDRPDFERLLDTALSNAEFAVGAGRGRPLDPERLRARALGATAEISATASAEYEHYVGLRTELRRPAASGGPLGGGEGIRLTGGQGGGSSAGVAAAAAVLVPVLAGTAALIFLLVGYLLQLMDPEPSVASSMRQAGWIFAMLAVGAIVISMVALLLTAVRNGSTSIRAAASRDLTEQVDRAREEWRAALLERGIQPFIERALAGPGAGGPEAGAPDVGGPEVGGPDVGGPEGGAGGGGAYPAVRTDPTATRTPRLGYSRPAFSSPDDGQSTDGPSYSSPDFTSPDYGGPEHDPD
ncbi:hypothetical protein O7599_20030 [Streptomyces sp. WMMC500]|uniref:hypothetical protein n=1 Tax=Streptomyces sp. WMMC500 TaxID=3015154 RepID=UPI00248BFE05|nr:hypothetical protein [Streptomyces sp. WMMC500]WBB57957.1 hypothetical protein O7599_20030 [Streptomyces sp. WMMC500]